MNPMQESSEERRQADALQRGNRAEPSAALRARILAEFDGASRPAQPRRYAGMALTLATLAATALIFVYLRHQDAGDTPHTSITAAVVSAADQFLVLYPQPAQQSAVVQELRDFEVRRKQVGEALGNYTLQGVSTDALELKGPDDAVTTQWIATLNADAEQRLQREVAGLRAAFQGGNFDATQLQRLRKICGIGFADAVRLLEDVATAPSGLQSVARESVALAREIRQIRQTIEWTRKGALASRLKAVHALGTLDSGIAVQALQNLACDTADDVALAGVNALAARGKNNLAALQVIAEARQHGPVHDAAATAVDKLLQEMDNHAD